MSVISGFFGALSHTAIRSGSPHTSFSEDWISWVTRIEDIVRQRHASTKVNSRHLPVPLKRYPKLTDFADFGAANRIVIEHAMDLA